jgi:hypothetical protein
MVAGKLESAHSPAFHRTVRSVARKTRPKRTRNLSPESPLTPVNCDSESVRQRLARIESNYALLDELLADLEIRVPQPSDPSVASANPHKPR